MMRHGHAAKHQSVKPDVEDTKVYSGALPTAPALTSQNRKYNAPDPLGKTPQPAIVADPQPGKTVMKVNSPEAISAFLEHARKMPGIARCLTPMAIDFVEPEPQVVAPSLDDIPSFPTYIIDGEGRYCELQIPKEYVAAKKLLTPKEARAKNLVEIKCGHSESVDNPYFYPHFALAVEHRFRSIGINIAVMAVGDQNTRESHDGDTTRAKRHDFLITLWLNLNRTTGRRLFFELLTRRNEISDLVIGAPGPNRHPVRFMMPRSDAAKFFEGKFDPTTIHPLLLECVLEAAPKEGCRQIAVDAMYHRGLLTKAWRVMLLRMNYPEEVVHWYPLYSYEVEHEVYESAGDNQYWW